MKTKIPVISMAALEAMDPEVVCEELRILTSRVPETLSLACDVAETLLIGNLTEMKGDTHKHSALYFEGCGKDGTLPRDPFTSGYLIFLRGHWRVCRPRRRLPLRCDPSLN